MLAEVLTILSDPAHASYVVGVTVLLFGAAVLLASLSKAKEPHFEGPQLYDETAKNLDIAELNSKIKHGFLPWKGRKYTVMEPHGESVVLPTEFMEDVKSLPEEICGITPSVEEQFLSKWSLFIPPSVGGKMTTWVHSINNGLTKSLGNIMEDIDDEVNYAFKDTFPACKDWTEMGLFTPLTRIVALVSGRAFVGSPLNRNEEYLDCIINFTLAVFFAAPKIRAYPVWSRWLSKYFSPEVRNIHQSLATMQLLMAPLIKQTLKGLEKDTAPPTLAMWHLKLSPEEDKHNLKIQSQVQLATSSAAIHTTSMTVTNAVYDLAMRPEYMEPLRKEIVAVKAMENKSYLTKSSMPKLRKLDSFLKESHRTSPLLVISMRRKLMQPITLHDGTRLPSGTRIAFPLHEVSQDPALWDKPEVFDGFRFQKLRDQPGNENKFQFTATGMHNLDFGHGTHACPGRFFAANEIKCMLVYLLEHYDFRFPDRITSRPGNIWMPGGYYTDPTVKVMVKKRKDVGA